MNGIVSAMIVAGPIENTGHSIPDLGQQLSMDHTRVMLYITPTMARQWIGVLEQIAKEND